eukprot:scaffold3438_cov114-Amphora_coffeaeformis.AAC.1
MQLHIGKSVLLSILLNKVYPKRTVGQRYTNAKKNCMLQGCVVLREELYTVIGQVQKCVVFVYNIFPHQELHAIKRWPITRRMVSEVKKAVGRLPHIGIVDEDLLSQAQNTNLDIDDDNQPVPKSMPTP